MRRNTTTIYKLADNLTHENAVEYREKIKRLIEDFDDHLQLDCKDLKNLDADGIGVITWAYYEMSLDRRRLTLDNVNGQPQCMLDTLSILEIFTGQEKCVKPYKMPSSAQP